MKKVLAVLVLTVFAASLFVGCTSTTKETVSSPEASAAASSSAGTYKDGDYTAKSDPDERGNYAEIKINVAGGKIASVDFKEYTKDGKEKDENYGKTSGDDNYKKAQDALKAAKTFGPKLVETQDVEKVDVVSGATSSNELFKTLAKKALESAK